MEEVLKWGEERKEILGRENSMREMAQRWEIQGNVQEKADKSSLVPRTQLMGKAGDSGKKTNEDPFTEGHQKQTFI